jgi:N6-adenosine-specific RNA methylase IME4
MSGAAESGVNLPALLARAGQRLLDARDAAEVLEAKHLAEAALHYAKVTKAANETHADCLRIITRAEMRMADEIDRGQERGDVSVAGGDRQTIVRTSDNAPATFDDLDIDRRRVAEWREIRDAGESVVEAVIRRALDEGHAPTKALILEAAKEIRAERADEKRAARNEMLNEASNYNAPLPQDRKYPIIYADPPWQYDFSPSDSRSVENHYPTMAIEEILALPVADLATPDAMLFLWAPPSFIKKGLMTLEAWGFDLATSMVWVKDKIGTGIYVRQRHEYLLLGKRGQPITPRPGSQPDSVIEAPRQKHSAKPASVYDIIERMYPGLPKIELFSRASRSGFDAWGNQAEAA